MKYLILILIFSVFSCASTKQEYQVLEAVTKNCFNKYNTVRILHATDNYFPENHFNIYLETRKYILSIEDKQIRTMAEQNEGIRWIFDEHAWDLNEEDIKYMRESIVKNQFIYLTSERLKNSKVKLVDFENISNCSKVKIISEETLKNNDFVFRLFTPLFNKNKKKAIVKIEVYYSDFSNNNFILLKKIKGKWVVLNE